MKVYYIEPDITILKYLYSGEGGGVNEIALGEPNQKCIGKGGANTGLTHLELCSPLKKKSLSVGCFFAYFCAPDITNRNVFIT